MTSVSNLNYIDFNVKKNYEDPKFDVVDHVSISKYQSDFEKGYMSNWSKHVFVIKKVKNTLPWTYVISNLHGEEIVGMFYKI